MNRSVIAKSIAAFVVAVGLLSAPVEAAAGPIALQINVDAADAGGCPVRAKFHLGRPDWRAFVEIGASGATIGVGWS